ncbi:MAG TPA: site-2 protease family protein [Vicinamibacterales bacterium]|nr:site-2 protease family protein [Vicinamibacterales bacterium]
MPPEEPPDQYDQLIQNPLPPPHGRLWVQLGLFGLTLVTTTIVGAQNFAFFSLGFGAIADLVKQDPRTVADAVSRHFSYWNGLWYSLTILGILGCHEMGHYVACLRYNITATRPYFLPLPPADFTLTGTLGAFIRVKSRFPDKPALFDVGVAGPIAGFVVAVPALFIGVALSKVEVIPPDMPFGLTLGEPLLFQLAQYLIWGSIPDGQSLNMHPMAFGAWFGLIATALNLFPVAQLDGGHISYAVLGPRSVKLTYAMILVAIALTVFSLSWIVWTVLLLVMLAVVGPHHPPTLNDEVPIGRGRLIIAGLAVVILIVCFTPAPISPFEP